MAIINIQVTLRTPPQLYHKAVVRFQPFSGKKSGYTREYYGDLGLWREKVTNKRVGTTVLKALDNALTAVKEKAS